MLCYLFQLNDKAKLKAQWIRGTTNEIQEKLDFNLHKSNWKIAEKNIGDIFIGAGCPDKDFSFTTIVNFAYFELATVEEGMTLKDGNHEIKLDSASSRKKMEKEQTLKILGSQRHWNKNGVRFLSQKIVGHFYFWNMTNLFLINLFIIIELWEQASFIF